MFQGENPNLVKWDEPTVREFGGKKFTADLQKVMERLSLTMLESYINLNHGPCI